ncbi:MAG: hypothetical protein KKH83_00585 [Candidatus Margulisbacteria bacterium]|nr:hypothetical protein [Candidatus Margulisiibacteriota bacterium]
MAIPSSFSRPINITDQIKRLQNQSVMGPSLSSIDPRILQGLADILSKKALSGIRFHFDEENTSVKGEDLFAFLAERKFEPSSLVCALKILNDGLKSGALSPNENDNQIHLKLGELVKAARDPKIQSKLAALVAKMQKEGFKNPGTLLAPQGQRQPSLPFVAHNPSFSARSIAQLEEKFQAADSVEVNNPETLLRACLGGYCEAKVIRGAIAELQALGWEIV